MKPIYLAPLLLLPIGCTRQPTPAEPARTAVKAPAGTFEIAKDPAAHWQRASADLETNPATASMELVSAGKFLSMEASSLEGEAKKKALDANISRMEDAIERLEKTESSEAKSSMALLRMQVAKDALAAGDARLAEEAAESVLAGSTDKNDWNYGNAIYEMNMVMAGVALDRGILAEARRRVLMAADTPGSPQLDSFGPKFPIVYRMMQDGDRDLMLEFLKRISRFWNSELPKKWAATIKRGDEPNEAMWTAATGQRP